MIDGISSMEKKDIFKPTILLFWHILKCLLHIPESKEQTHAWMLEVEERWQWRGMKRSYPLSDLSFNRNLSPLVFNINNLFIWVVDWLESVAFQHLCSKASFLAKYERCCSYSWAADSYWFSSPLTFAKGPRQNWLTNVPRDRRFDKWQGFKYLIIAEMKCVVSIIPRGWVIVFHLSEITTQEMLKNKNGHFKQSACWIMNLHQKAFCLKHTQALKVDLDWQWVHTRDGMEWKDASWHKLKRHLWKMEMFQLHFGMLFHEPKKSRHG